MGEDAVGVAVEVGSLVVHGLVKGPVLVEVAAGTDSPKAEDGLGAGQAPAGAGDVHAVLDEVAAGTFDDAGGDGEAGGEVFVVAEVFLVVQQVVGAAVDGLALRGRQTTLGRAATHAGGDIGDAAAQEAVQALVHPVFGRVLALAEEGVRGAPEVLDDVDDVDDHDDFDARLADAALDAVELVLGSVDEHHPPLFSLGVPFCSLLEGLGDHGGGVVHDARPHAFALGLWPRWSRYSLLGGGTKLLDDVLGGANVRRYGVDGRDLGHPPGQPLLALASPPLAFGSPLLRSFAGRRPQILAPHRHAFSVRGDHHVLARTLVRGGVAKLVERLHVRRGPHRQLFDLSLRNVHTSRRLDRLHDRVERHLRGLPRDEPTQPQRVELPRQAQLGVHDCQAVYPALTVTKAADVDLAEDRLQPPRPLALVGPFDAVRPDHRLRDDPQPAELELVLDQQPHHLAALDQRVVLDLPVRHSHALRVDQPLLESLVRRIRRRKEIVLLSRLCFHAAGPFSAGGVFVVCNPIHAPAGPVSPKFLRETARNHYTSTSSQKSCTHLKCNVSAFTALLVASG